MVAEHFQERRVEQVFRAGVRIPLPENLFIKGIEATLSGGVGRYWFGNVAPEIGDYRLPAYTYWHAGVAFKVEPLTLDLSYHNTNLSKEDCFVFTGDPGATPGGAMNNFQQSERPTLELVRRDVRRQAVGRAGISKIKMKPPP